MDREVLFRGKRIDNGEWVEGFLFPYRAGQVGIGRLGMNTRITHPDGSFGEWDFINLYDLFCPKVFAETVGQYTGLIDKNGTMIFEGDVLRLDKEEYIVRFGIAGFELLRKCVSTPISAWYGTDVIGDDSTLFEVIGNIHDQGV